MKRILFPYLAALLFFSFSTEKNMTGNPPVNKVLMLRMVNELRAKGCHCGDAYQAPAPPLVWSDKLEQAAQLHSNDMLKKNYFSHIEADGSNAGQRIENAGYKWKAYGENIGMGYTDEKQVLDGWIKSTEHCKNLMNKKYTEMGVARAGTYWTQDFASR